MLGKQVIIEEGKTTLIIWLRKQGSIGHFTASVLVSYTLLRLPVSIILNHVCRGKGVIMLCVPCTAKKKKKKNQVSASNDIECISHWTCFASYVLN